MRRLTILVLYLYAGLTAYSILRIILKEPFLPLLTPLLTLLACVFAALHAFQRLGWKRMILLMALSFGISLLLESLGVRTGLVYGSYYYTDRLGIKFLGLVPLLIPVAWFMMQYPSLLIAETIAGFNESPGGLFAPKAREKGPANGSVTQARASTRASLSSILWVAALGGVVMTAWDLAMDPLMTAGGQWVWNGTSGIGSYFGIPLHNFLGWWLTTFIIFGLYLFLTRAGEFWKVENQEYSFNPPAELRIAGVSVSTGFLTSWEYMSKPAFDRLAVYSYLTTSLGCILTNLLVGLSGPALAGFFAITPWIIAVWPLLN